MYKNCICINDQGRPAEVPANQWVVKGEQYTIIKIVNCLGQGIQGAELEEVKVDSALYKYFALSRFAPIVDADRYAVEQLEEV